MSRNALDRLDALITLSETPGNSTWLSQCTADLRSIRAELVALKKKDLNQLRLPWESGLPSVRPRADRQRTKSAQAQGIER